MKIFRVFRNNIFVLFLAIVIVFFGIRIFFTQEDYLNSLYTERIQRENELMLAKQEYEKTFNLENLSNTSESKENQIRERLNMIKKDEIQFLFTKDN